MSPDFVRYYARELAHLRGSAYEFAQTYPKIAGRLGLDEFDCADPYVERLLEGFAFLAARVQLKIDAEFPAFIQNMLALVYPSYLAPLPSMTIVQFQPDLLHPALSGGLAIPRGSALRGMLGVHAAQPASTRCEFRTAHAMTLFPIEVVEATAFPLAPGREWRGRAAGQPERGEQRRRDGRTVAARHGGSEPRGCIRMRLRTGGARAFSQTGLNNLSIHLRGSDALPMRLYEILVANVTGVIVTPVSDADDGVSSIPNASSHDVSGGLRRGARAEPAWRFELPADSVSTVGFEDDEALLPGASRTFSGYRLLQEYFGLASRYLFIQLGGLAGCLATAAETQIDIVFLLNVSDTLLERSLNASHFALHCTPAINLFSRRIDRVAIKAGQHEHHVVVDRTRPIDFEIHTVETVAGYRTGQSEAIAVAPLFEAHDDGAYDGAYDGARDIANAGNTAGLHRDAFFYQLRRERRLVSPSAPSRRDAIRSGYVGSEAFIALTGSTQDAMDDTQSALQQLAIRALCTNRDLPLTMPLGMGATDFSFDGEAPLWSIRCVGGISPPQASIANGAAAWRLLSHLSLNYASLVNSDAANGADKDGSGVANKGAEALRELLGLYCAPHDMVAARQVEGVRAISTQRVSRRVASKGPLTFGRGMEVTVVLDDAAFEGGSAFLMGAVLARFFTQYVSVNAFVETVVRTLSRGEIMRWSPRTGQCPTL